MSSIEAASCVVERIALAKTASAVTNNLCLLRDNKQDQEPTDEDNDSYGSPASSLKLGIVSGCSFHIADLANRECSRNVVWFNAGATPPNITKGKWLTVGNETYLALLSFKGVQILDGDGAVLLFNHQLKSFKRSSIDSSDLIERDVDCCQDDDGSAVVRQTEVPTDLTATTTHICVGTSRGRILFITCEGTDVSLSVVKRENNEPIVALAACDDTLATANQSGLIIVWKEKQNGNVVKEHTMQGPPNCTALVCNEQRLIVGYGNGQMRIYSTQSGQLLTDVCAHALWLTSLMLTDNLLVSTSEDGFVRMWKLPTDGSETISHHSYTRMDHQLLMGSAAVQDHHPDLYSVFVSAYDQQYIYRIAVQL